MGFARVLLSLLVLVSTSALQLQPMVRVAAVGASPLRVPAAPRCQFGQNKPDTEQKGISRDDEPEEFFKSDWGARPPPPPPPPPQDSSPPHDSSPRLGRLHRRLERCGEAQEPGRYWRNCPDRGTLHHRCYRAGGGTLSRPQRRPRVGATCVQAHRCSLYGFAWCYIGPLCIQGPRVTGRTTLVRMSTLTCQS